MAITSKTLVILGWLSVCAGKHVSANKMEQTRTLRQSQTSLEFRLKGAGRRSLIFDDGGDHDSIVPPPADGPAYHVPGYDYEESYPGAYAGKGYPTGETGKGYPGSGSNVGKGYPVSEVIPGKGYPSYGSGSGESGKGWIEYPNSGSSSGKGWVEGKGGGDWGVVCFPREGRRLKGEKGGSKGKGGKGSKSKHSKSGEVEGKGGNAGKRKVARFWDWQ
jgi:hypothetical protein